MIATEAKTSDQRLNDASSDSIATHMEKLSLIDHPVMQTAATSHYKGPHFPPSYVRVIEEPSEDAHTATKVKELLERYRRENDTTVNDFSDFSLKSKKGQTRLDSRAGGGEVYEKSVARHGNKTFQKFHKQLSKCPQQIMR